MSQPFAKIPVLGVGGDGAAGLTARSRDLLADADLVLGSDNVLRLLPDLKAQRYRIGSDLQEVVETIRSRLGQQKMVVVATGDPLFYGVARYLCDKIGPEQFDVVPHVSSMQLAFARIKESWEEAYLTDVGSRPLDDVLDRIRTAETVGLFTSEAHDPPTIARGLLARGIDYFRAFVCENLGGPDERVTQGELSEIAEMEFDPLNVLILRRKPDRPDASRGGRKLMRFGNPDEIFAQSRPKSGLITQAEVRALALAQMDLQPGGVAWDVGAGSGSVAIEAAQLVGPGVVYAIEQEAPDYHLMIANAETFGIKNVKPVFGMAPAVFHGLPAPDAIFIGGNGGEVARLLEASFTALRPGGRLVVNVGTLEMLSAVYAMMKRLASPVQVQLVNIARGVEQMESLRFESVNPTFLLTARKPADGGR
ncbi:MAG: precorrin-6y C5,15-methyltransferase (decarboxylating) subunit CbiE [Gemmataceae bacterium]